MKSALGLEGGGGGGGGAIRFSLDEYNTQDDIDYILGTMPSVIDKLKGRL